MVFCQSMIQRMQLVFTNVWSPLALAPTKTELKTSGVYGYMYVLEPSCAWQGALLLIIVTLQIRQSCCRRNARHAAGRRPWNSLSEEQQAGRVDDALVNIFDASGLGGLPKVLLRSPHAGPTRASGNTLTQKSRRLTECAA